MEAILTAAYGITRTASTGAGHHSLLRTALSYQCHRPPFSHSTCCYTDCYFARRSRSGAEDDFSRSEEVVLRRTEDKGNSAQSCNVGET